MTKMIDTEGDALPNNGPDDKYDNCWDINLWGDGELSLSIPMSFDAGDGGNYNGAGVVTVRLRELLQEYLDDCDRLDGGEGLQPLAAMFREFADKYEAAAKTPNGRGQPNREAVSAAPNCCVSFPRESDDPDFPI